MLTGLQVVYCIIAAALSLTAVWALLREKSLFYALNLGLICVPLILRALLIK